jgi:hypothetical protein
MTQPWGSLRLDVVDDEIIIVLPGTTYSVTYYKPPNSPSFSQETSRTQMIGGRPLNYLTSSRVLGSEVRDERGPNLCR